MASKPRHPAAIIIVILLGLVFVVIVAREAARAVELRAQGPDALHEAAYRGSIEDVRWLLKLRADPNAPNSRNQTPLGAVVSSPVAWEDKLEIYRLLLDAGADVSVQAVEGETLLIYMLRQAYKGEGAVNAAKLLIEHGVDVNEPGEKGWSPLYIAGARELDNLAKLLIGAGAIVGPTEAVALGDGETLKRQIRDDPRLATKRFTDGDLTLLMIAAGGTSTEIVKTLLDAGADPNFESMYLSVAMDYAVSDLKTYHLSQRPLKSVSQETVSLLIAHGADLTLGQPPLLWAARYADVETIQFLLDAGADPSAEGEAVEMVLSGAANRTDDDAEGVVSLLLQHGARVDAADRWGNTPLHHAVRIGVVRLLIEHGANVNAQDSNGRTPLHKMIWVDGGRPQIVKMLLKHGANPHIRNASGRSPFEEAVGRRYDEIIEVFREHEAAIVQESDTSFSGEEN